MSSLRVNLPSIAVSPRRPQGQSGTCDRRAALLTKYRIEVPGLGSQPFQTCTPNSNVQARRLHSSAMICMAALNARCGAEQTQTVTRQSSTITIAPVQGKEKSPELDDGGTGLPPRDDGDGGGGGGGGWGGWSGGFFFFGFLAFLGFIKDKEEEGPYQDSRRRRPAF